MSTNINTSILLSEYVDAAKQGDQHAFTKLVGLLNNTVGAIALAITKDLQHSQDVSQIVFTKLWQQLDQLNNSQSVLPWIRQITRYSAINYIRDKKLNSEQAVSDQDIEQLLCDVSEQTQQDSELIKQQQSQLIAHLLDQLPNESREIVLLYYRQDHNTQAVAQLLDLTPATVRKRLQRVREILKEQVLARYGKVIFASAPVGVATMLATAAMSSTPVAAATLSSSLAGSQSHWLVKLGAIVGGAGIGGGIALLTNHLVFSLTLKNIDNQADIKTLKRIQIRLNIMIVLSCLLLGLSYEFSQGWLAPVIAYAIFTVSLMRGLTMVNVITRANLQRQAVDDAQYQQKLRRGKICGAIGFIFGILGGWSGLLYGLASNGRFEQLL